MAVKARSLWAALLAAPLALAGLGVSPAAAETEELTPVQRFAGCVAGGGQGNALLLIDTSSSLNDTDPLAGRVTAATTTIERMSESLLATPGAEAHIAVASFGPTYNQTLGWTPLSEGPQPVEAVTADVAQYATRVTSVDTDYWTALDGARREFTARNKEQANPCNLLLWFSDGAFHINTRSSAAKMEEWGGPKAWMPDNDLANREKTAAVMAAGEADLCRAGGLADQVRSLGIITVGIGLAVDATPERFDLMRGISTGEQSCGEQVSPSPGEFVMATDIDELIYGFITALEPGEGGEQPVCVDGVCPEGTRVFVLDGSIGAVSATAIAPAPGTRVILQTKGGEEVDLTQGEGTRDTSGASLTWQWASERVLTFDLKRTDAAAWAGPWSIVFVADEASDQLAKSSITLKGDIAPKLGEVPELRSGEAPVDLTVGVVDSDGERIDPTSLSEETFLTVQLRTRDGVETLADQLVRGAMEEPITLDLADVPPGSAELLLTLDVTTQSWTDGTQTVVGTRLEPRHASMLLNVMTPADFPTMASKVSFGTTETDEPVTVTLPLEGSGCAWLGDDATFTGYPEGLADAQLSSPANNRSNCSSGELELTLAPGGLGTGSFIGTTTVWLAPEDSTAEPVAVALAFEMDQQRPLSQPILWGTLIAVVLLGIAIPVGILYLVKFLTAKIPGQAMRAGTVSGFVTDREAFTDGGVPLPKEQLALAHITNPREVTVAGRVLKAKMGGAPTEPGYVVVETPGVSAGGLGSLQQVRTNAKLPLGVQGSWMVALNPQNPHTGPVEVTLFTGPNAAGYEQLQEDVRTNIRSAVEKLRQDLPAEPGGSAAADPWGGPGPSNAPVQPPADPWANPGSGQQDPWANPPSSNNPGGPATW